jgi:hypothetical protein
MSEDHWVRKMYRDADSMDPVRAMSWLTDDASQRMGSAPATSGIAAARAGYERMLSAVDSMAHDFIGIWDVDEGVTVAEALVTYRRKRGAPVTLPVTTILRRRGDKVADIRIYMDPAPLFSE